MLCTATIQIYMINATMSSGKVIIAVPSYSSLTIVLTITGGAIFYGDFKTMDRYPTAQAQPPTTLAAFACAWG